MANLPRKFKEGIALEEVSADPSNPVEGQLQRSDGTARAKGMWEYRDGEWRLLGQVQGVINHIDNSDLEVDAVGFADYADAAAALPVDGTGGAPTLSSARNTTTPLRGVADLKITKDAANRQGEGTSYDLTIDEADTDSVLSVVFDHKATANYVSGDLIAIMYDVTNSKLITLDPDSDIAAGQGRWQGTFNSTSSTSYRLIWHVATTNASAWDMQIDNIQCGPQQLNFGPAMTDWQEFTMDIEGTTTNPTKGTVAEDVAIWRRVGDSMEIKYSYKQTAGGTAGSGRYRFRIPDGYTINTNLVPINGVGSAHTAVGSARVQASEGNLTGVVVLGDTTGLEISVGDEDTSTSIVQSVFADLADATVEYGFICTVPISGWSTNVVTSESRTFNISSVLANGTRVTTTPATLGEYRTSIKGASSNATTDTTVTQTNASISSDGPRVFAKRFSLAGTAGEPTRWEIFIGKDKHFKPRYFSSTGKTGPATCDRWIDGAEEAGLYVQYDPTTGNVVIDAGTCDSSSITSRFASDHTGPGLSGRSTATDVYFDLVVSDNALAVQQEALTSLIRLDTGNGHGSTNTKIRRFSTIREQVGTSMTLNQSAADGDSITINKDGVYGISYLDERSSGASPFGISRNSTELTSSIDNIVANDRLIQELNATNAYASCSVQIPLKVGDVIRAHTDGNHDATAVARTMFSIARIG